MFAKLFSGKKPLILKNGTRSDTIKAVTTTTTTTTQNTAPAIVTKSPSITVMIQPSKPEAPKDVLSVKDRQLFDLLKTGGTLEMMRGSFYDLPALDNANIFISLLICENNNIYCMYYAYWYMLKYPELYTNKDRNETLKICYELLTKYFAENKNTSKKDMELVLVICKHTIYECASRGLLSKSYVLGDILVNMDNMHPTLIAMVGKLRTTINKAENGQNDSIYYVNKRIAWLSTIPVGDPLYYHAQYGIAIEYGDQILNAKLYSDRVAKYNELFTTCMATLCNNMKAKKDIDLCETNIIAVRNHVRKLKADAEDTPDAIDKQTKMIAEQSKQIAEQSRQIAKQSEQINKLMQYLMQSHVKQADIVADSVKSSQVVETEHDAIDEDKIQLP